jgi:hypothetical protein
MSGGWGWWGEMGVGEGGVRWGLGERRARAAAAVSGAAGDVGTRRPSSGVSGSCWRGRAGRRAGERAGASALQGAACVGGEPTGPAGKSRGGRPLQGEPTIRVAVVGGQQPLVPEVREARVLRGGAEGRRAGGWVTHVGRRGSGGSCAAAAAGAAAARRASPNRRPPAASCPGGLPTVPAGRPAMRRAPRPSPPRLSLPGCPPGLSRASSGGSGPGRDPPQPRCAPAEGGVRWGGGSAMARRWDGG